MDGCVDLPRIERRSNTDMGRVSQAGRILSFGQALILPIS